MAGLLTVPFIPLVNRLARHFGSVDVPGGRRDHDGEIPRLLEMHQCGTCVRSGNGPGLAQHILQLAGDPQLCHDMGRRARGFLESELRKELALGRWADTITQISVPSSGTISVVTTAARQN